MYEQNLKQKWKRTKLETKGEDEGSKSPCGVNFEFIKEFCVDIKILSQLFFLLIFVYINLKMLSFYLN